MEKRKTILALLFLLMFLAAKTSITHAFSHDTSEKENIETCLVCDWAIDHHQDKLLITATKKGLEKQPDFTASKSQPTFFSKNSVLDFARQGLFCRPPPSLG